MQSSAQIAPALDPVVPRAADDPLEVSHHGLRARTDTAVARVLVAVLCALFIALPFVVVAFPPITDLPQHVAQIRLFLTALNDPGSGYAIQWFTPYSAVYVLLGFAWWVSTPLAAGRLAVMALGVLWTLAVHGVAARRRRALAAAVLASVLFFNHGLYWGFLSFIVGFPVFAAWLLLTCRPAAPRWTVRLSVAYCGLAGLLYVSHALWLGAGIAWLVVVGALHRFPRSENVWRAASVAPVLIAAALWYPHLAASGFQSDTVWAAVPSARLSYGWLAASLLGGLRGPTEGLFLVLLAAWIGAGLWQHHATLRTDVDRDLLAAGLMLFVFAILLPDKHMNTIQFAARWMAPAAILLVLAVPAPRTAYRMHAVLALIIAAVFCFTTTIAWLRFEREELSGLSEVLRDLPAGNPRVIGLDFVKSSVVVTERPFLQTFAYAQVERGGRLNFSFASFAPSLVVFRQPKPIPWTPGLEWFPERVRPADFRYFDYAVINAPVDVHDRLATQGGLVPRADHGRWRLYQIAPPGS